MNKPHATLARDSRFDRVTAEVFINHLELHLPVKGHHPFGQRQSENGVTSSSAENKPSQCVVKQPNESDKELDNHLNSVMKSSPDAVEESSEGEKNRAVQLSEGKRNRNVAIASVVVAAVVGAGGLWFKYSKSTEPKTETPPVLSTQPSTITNITIQNNPPDKTPTAIKAQSTPHNEKNVVPHTNTSPSSVKEEAEVPNPTQTSPH